MLYNWTFTLTNIDGTIARTDVIIAPSAADARLLYDTNIINKLQHAKRYEFIEPIGYLERTLKIECSGEVIAISKQKSAQEWKLLREVLRRASAEYFNQAAPSNESKSIPEPKPEPLLEPEPKKKIEIRTNKDGEPMVSVIGLNEPCPTCGNGLYAWWATCCSNMPELGSWQVDCASKEDCYSHDYPFYGIDSLQDEFTIDCNNINPETFYEVGNGQNKTHNKSNN